MTLTEFLLARIAEDEAAAERGRSHPDPTAFANDNYGYLWVQPERVLADCETKRRIVEEARDYSPELADGDNGEWAFDFVLRALAAYDADHPDFQEEWQL